MGIQSPSQHKAQISSGYPLIKPYLPDLGFGIARGSVGLCGRCFRSVSSHFLSLLQVGQLFREPVPIELARISVQTLHLRMSVQFTLTLTVYTIGCKNLY